MVSFRDESAPPRTSTSITLRHAVRAAPRHAFLAVARLPLPPPDNTAFLPFATCFHPPCVLLAWSQTATTALTPGFAAWPDLPIHQPWAEASGSPDVRDTWTWSAMVVNTPASLTPGGVEGGGVAATVAAIAAKVRATPAARQCMGAPNSQWDDHRMVSGSPAPSQGRTAFPTRVAHLAVGSSRCPVGAQPAPGTRARSYWSHFAHRQSSIGADRCRAGADDRARCSLPSCTAGGSIRARRCRP